jgi:hypothetical protein
MNVPKSVQRRRVRAAERARVIVQWFMGRQLVGVEVVERVGGAVVRRLLAEDIGWREARLLSDRINFSPCNKGLA